MPADISLEEWFAELARLGVGHAGDGEAVTITELTTQTHHSARWVRDRVKAAIRDGKMIGTRKRMVTMDGRETLVPAYRFVDEREKPKKKK